MSLLLTTLATALAIAAMVDLTRPRRHPTGSGRRDRRRMESDRRADDRRPASAAAPTADHARAGRRAHSAGALPVDRARSSDQRRPARRSPLVALLIAAGRRAGARRVPDSLARALDAAGAPLGLTVAELAALKGALAAVALTATLPWTFALPGRLPVALLLAAPAAGFLAPDWALRRRAMARASRIAAELGDVLDLLRVATAAGLSLERALREVGARHPGLLAAELRRTAAQLALGVERDAALTTLERRCPADGIPELIAALRGAARSGAPLQRTLAAHALEARALHARRIADRAARAAPRMQLVVALLLVPSVLLLVAAGLLAGVAGRGA